MCVCVYVCVAVLDCPRACLFGGGTSPARRHAAHQQRSVEGGSPTLRGGWRDRMVQSPRSRALVKNLRLKQKPQGLQRVEKACRICRRSNNLPDPINPDLKIEWAYGLESKVDPESGLEVVQGRVDKYCNKAALDWCVWCLISRCRIASCHVCVSHSFRPTACTRSTRRSP